MQNNVEFKMDMSKGIDKIIKALDRSVGRDAVKRLAIMLEDEVLKYVPVGETGKLSKKNQGYTLRSGVNKEGGWVKIDFNNNKLPYVMYQYRGIVYGPNFAQFDSAGNQIPGAWKSGKKPKRKTNYPLGVERTVTLKDGRVVHITGYTNNKNARAEWVKEVRTDPEIWYPLRYKMWEDIRDNFRKSAK